MSRSADDHDNNHLLDDTFQNNGVVVTAAATQSHNQTSCPSAAAADISDKVCGCPKIATTTTNGSSGRNGNCTGVPMAMCPVEIPHPPPTDDNEGSYGWGGNCTPSGLQFMANKKAFLAIFCLTCVVQGTFQTYFVAVITTLEKLFNIPSQTIGTMMMGIEIGQVVSGLFLPYYAGQGHRPRWMGFGSALFAVASTICASPHLLIPMMGNANQGDIFSSLGNAENATAAGRFCQTFLPNLTTATNCQNFVATIDPPHNTPHGNLYVLLFAVVFLSLLCIGFGQTAIFTLGIPYLDDNVANRESPLYFSITIGVRILGPVTGFVLGSLCTRLYIHPLSPPPDFGPSDPRWLGAWWLGMLLISSCLAFTSILMAGFPKKLPTNNQQLQLQTDEHNKPQEKILIHDNGVKNGNGSSVGGKKPGRSIGDFWAAVRRLLGNKVLVLRTFSSVFHLLPISGLYTFLPKYLESQFRLAAFQANMVTGIAGILVMGVGIFSSGLFIRKRSPSPTAVAGWVALSAAVYAAGILTLAFLGCDASSDYVISDFSHPACLTTTCNSCSPREFSPVCGSDKKIYFSPCHAGCPDPLSLNHNGSAGYNDPTLRPSSLGNCSCVSPEFDGLGSMTAVQGLCELECNRLWLYVLVFMIIVLVHSTSEVGSMLLTLRCVEPRDKAMALGLIQCAIGIFGNVPCPVIYGAVVDTACLVWGNGAHGNSCGPQESQGHCLLYDSSKFRLYFHGLTCALMLVAFLIDIFVFFHARRIDFDRPPVNGGGENSREKLPAQQLVQMQPLLSKQQQQQGKT